MGKNCLLFFVFFLFVNCVSFAGRLGPPEPPGESPDTPVSVSVGYFHARARLEPDNSDGDNINVTQDRLYLQTAYRVQEQWEGYFRIGGANFKARDAFHSSDDFKDGFQAFASVGLRGLLYEMPQHHFYRFGFGPFLQAGLYSSYTDRTEAEKLKLETPWEVNLGLAGQLKFSRLSDTTLYGGPCLYYSAAKAKHEHSLGPDSTTYEEQNMLGVFGGLRIPLPEEFSVNVEAQYKSRLSTGISVMKSF